MSSWAAAPAADRSLKDYGKFLNGALTMRGTER
jgi:hypothetical protein